uniref:Uncharacterized protein n=1 Tax=Arundo donax TaxID=35708 RepID=A0A0A8YIN0_ARUDO
MSMNYTSRNESIPRDNIRLGHFLKNHSCHVNVPQLRVHVNQRIGREDIFTIPGSYDHGVHLPPGFQIP